MYKIRIILDTKEDVLRTILVNNTIHLEDLHYAISRSFGFKGLEMASFYTTDSEWSQGTEIPLFDMSEVDRGICMKDCLLQDALPHKNDKLIYVYDFLNLWTFYVDVVEVSDQIRENDLEIVFSKGEIPIKAPEKKFIADNLEEDEGQEYDDDFDFNEY